MHIRCGILPWHWLLDLCDAMLTVPQLSHLADSLQSWLYGNVIKRLEPEAMALGESHGYETASSKRLMRQSVMISDLIGVSAPEELSTQQHSTAHHESGVSHILLLHLTVLVPALLACRRVFCRGASAEKGDLMLLGALMQPALLLIDHGHFQYNSISLGLAVCFPLSPLASHCACKRHCIWLLVAGI